MTNKQLITFITDYLRNSTNLRKDARIETTVHNDRRGVYVCLRVPHIDHRVSDEVAGHIVLEWSLPAGLMLHRINSENTIKSKIDKFLNFHDYLTKGICN